MVLLLNLTDSVFASLLNLYDFPWLKYPVVTLFFTQIAITLLSLVSWLNNNPKLTRLTVIIGLFIETASLTFTAFLLSIALILSYSSETANHLLVEAFFIWIVNFVLFSLWYWTIDGGGAESRKMIPKTGPNRWKRDIGNGQTRGMDFWFPQQSQEIPGWECWSPNYFDYLFLAFSTSTAFSPTDTLVLSLKVKLLMACQALNSLIALTVVAARAINGLK